MDTLLAKLLKDETMHAGRYAKSIPAGTVVEVPADFRKGYVKIRVADRRRIRGYVRVTDLRPL